MKCMSMLLSYIKIYSKLTFILSTSQETNYSCRLIRLSAKHEYFIDRQFDSSQRNGILKNKLCLIHIRQQYLWPFQNVSE